jgi:2-oxo-hept-3-ene-1,7-dioate hydratase
VKRALAVLLLNVALRAGAACPDASAIAAYVADFQVPRVSKGFGNDLTQADAECARRKLVPELTRVLGAVVGYKAAFTNPETQKRMGVAEPAWATMFAKNMVQSGARVPAKFGALPRYEADFLVVVKDEKLADATKPLEALQHISAVMPFIELPDLMLEGTPSATAFISTNVGFRGGVLGPRVPVEATQAFLDSLANMTVVMTEDSSGKEVGRARGSATEHPIHAVLWLARSLKKKASRSSRRPLASALHPARTAAARRASPCLPRNARHPAVTVHFE